jgi:5-methylcytosine-specific restriction endonuclease McrA
MEGNHVDHIIPRRLGGDDSLLNLQLLCASCNLSKGGFFDGNKTPMTLLGSFIPNNEHTSHYQDE